MGPSFTLLSTTMDTRSCAVAGLANAASQANRRTWRRMFDKSIIVRRVYDVRSGIARRGTSQTVEGIDGRAVACGGVDREPPQGFVHPHDRERVDRHCAGHTRLR